uniref:Protein-tyrosine sulfotransferase n=1 Tax=Parascaris univalens TaxID=6257 RepID=A0A915AIY6_PARUN
MFYLCICPPFTLIASLTNRIVRPFAYPLVSFPTHLPGQ